MSNLKSLLLATATLGMAVAAASTLMGAGDRNRNAGKEVTLTGKVVDLHCFMTEHFPSADQTKCTRDCLRGGVPAALETDHGVVLIGEGARSPKDKLMPLAFKQVEVKGKLYERHGVKYIDMNSIEESQAARTPEQDDEVIEEEEEPEDEEEYAPDDDE